MKKLALVALATLALFGCHKQSSLDFQDVAGKATIQGYVYVDRGYLQDGENYVVRTEPAEGCAVVVKVPYTKYDAEAGAGDKLFEGVCDANGHYSIEVPVGQAAISGCAVYTRPFVGPYYDLINNAIISTEVSYPEQSASVEIENGKTFVAANIIVSKDVEKPIFSRNQTVTIKGKIGEQYEEKQYIDPKDEAKGYVAVTGVTTPTQALKVQLKFINKLPAYDGQELVFNVTTATDGTFSTSVNLYDVWDINDVEVTMSNKAYLGSCTHYYHYYDKDEAKNFRRSQSVSGYYGKNEQKQMMTEGDLLIGCSLPRLVLTFTPDYANEKIYGIGEPTIDIVGGITVYTAENPLMWAY